MIVKNCPSFVEGMACASPRTTSKECEKNQCIMKQIVSALKEKTLEANEKILNILEVE